MKLVRFDRQDRAVCLQQDPLGDAAHDELAYRAAAAKADDNQIGIILVGCVQDFGSRVMATDRLLDDVLDA